MTALFCIIHDDPVSLHYNLASLIMTNNASNLPDYVELSCEYNEPDYHKYEDYSINLELYRKYRKVWAIHAWHDAMANYEECHPELTTLSIIDLPYYPTFPEYFVEKIAGIPEDGKRLLLANVEIFLEHTYGSTLEKPDCDYMIDLLTDTDEKIMFPQNIFRAIEWLEAKKTKLPLWPPQYTIDDSNNKIRVYTITYIKNLLEIEIQNNDSPAVTSSDSDEIFIKPNFGWIEVDKLATEVGIIANRKYALKQRHKASITGFIDALKLKGIIPKRTQPEWNRIFGDRYSIKVNTDRNRNVRGEFRDKTLRLLGAKGW